MPTSRHVPFIGIPNEQQLKNFFAKIGPEDPITGCTDWTAARCYHQDYPGDITQAQGKFNYNKRIVTAYRFVMYIELGYEDVGPTVDHLCHRRICCNVLHLRCCPQIENNRNRKPVLSDYCQKGHLRTLQSVGISSSTGNRFCRICARITDKARYTDKYTQEKALHTHTSEAIPGKLDEDKAWQILFTYYSQEEASSRSLGREFEVSPTMIRNVVNGKCWKSVYNEFVAKYPQVLGSENDNG